MLQTVRVGKVDEKKGSFVYFPCFLLELWSLNCQKSAFLRFGTGLSEKPKSLKAIYIYASESFHCTLSENGL